MDHLTWLMTIQESDEGVALQPLEAAVRQGAGRTVPQPPVSGKQAVQALTTALQEAVTAQRQFGPAAMGQEVSPAGLWNADGRENGAAAGFYSGGMGTASVGRNAVRGQLFRREAAGGTIGGDSSRGGYGSAVYTQVVREAGETDMEKVSRFFERDARRYG